MSSPWGAGPPGGEEGCLHGKEPCWGKRNPPEGSGYGGCLGRRNSVAELPSHQEPVRDSNPFQKQGLPQMQIQGTEEEAPPGMTGGLLCPLLWISPFQEGFRIWRRWGGPWRFQLRRSARIGTRGRMLPLVASQKLRRGEYEDALPQTSNRRVGELGDLESLDV